MNDDELTNDEWVEKYTKEYFAKKRDEKAALKKDETWFQKSVPYIKTGFLCAIPLTFVVLIVFGIKYFRKATAMLTKKEVEELVEHKIKKILRWSLYICGILLSCGISLWLMLLLTAVIYETISPWFR
ncbi:MAG: hypothetical protein LBS38_00315 [Endomicrobium sp.]|jgi:hypothetical protein|nr:hypothetical protein [Endomicrobium sp.]